MKVLVVGMNPSNRSPKKKIPKNSTLDRLNTWMDQCGIKYFSFINTCDTIANKLKKSDVDLEFVREATRGYDKIIALGKFASSCLTDVKVNHFEMPHPSPRNFLLNDKNYEMNKIAMCKNYIGERDAD